jgi:hypothetical protein
LRTEFGLSAEQANYEMDNHADEVMIHLKIWSLVSDRQDKDMKREQARAKQKGMV